MQHDPSGHGALHHDDATGEDSITENRYLIYTLGGESYGTPLTRIKEVLKKGDVRDVPYMKSYFKGIINLRGQIVSVIDLREKLAMVKDAKAADLMLVVENQGNSLAVIVDDVLSVAQIPDAQIETNPGLPSRVPMKFFMGVAKIDSKLVNLIQLDQVLSTEDHATVKRAKEAA